MSDQPKRRGPRDPKRVRKRVSKTGHISYYTRITDANGRRRHMKVPARSDAEAAQFVSALVASEDRKRFKSKNWDETEEAIALGHQYAEWESRHCPTCGHLTPTAESILLADAIGGAVK